MDNPLPALMKQAHDRAMLDAESALESAYRHLVDASKTELSNPGLIDVHVSEDRAEMLELTASALRASNRPGPWQN